MTITFSLDDIDLVPNTDKILHEDALPFDFENPPIDPLYLLENMKRILIDEKGLGLAAPQVGQPYRVFIVGDPSNPDSIMPFFNPRIVDLSGEDVIYEEGCLSYPGMFIKIKRPRTVRIRFANEKGEVQTMKFEGLTSRVVQHEYDHLEGVVFMKRANKFHLDAARRQKKRLDKQRNKK